MKIRKNLSDEEMFRGRREKLTFENGIHADGQSHHTKKNRKDSGTKGDFVAG